MPNWFIIILTLIVALILTVLPMPEWTIWLRPAWVLMILIYWSIVEPYQVGVGVAWLTGLITDILTGTLLGEHALAFTLIIYFISKMHIRMRLYPLLQQSFTLFILVLTAQFILYCIQGFIGELPNSHLYWLSSVTSMLLWPWLFIFIRDCRRWFNMA